MRVKSCINVSFLIQLVMKKISAIFYKNSNDKKPVRDWLYSLDKENRKIIGEDIKTVEYAYPIGMPTCRKLDNN